MPKPRKGWIEKRGASWRLQVRVGGQRIRRTYATREESERALEELLRTVEGDRQSALAKRLKIPTVARVIDEYYERRKPHLEDSTKARYDNVLEKYVLPELGPLDARELAASPVLLQDFLDRVPWGSARKALEVLGPALRMAHDNGLIPNDPVSKIRRPRRPDRRKKKEIPTPDEVEKMIIAAYEIDVWWGYYVELTAVLGTRRAETAALRWEDFTFPPRGAKHGVIRVDRAVGKRRGGIYLKLPRAGSSESSSSTDRSSRVWVRSTARRDGCFPGVRSGPARTRTFSLRPARPDASFCGLRTKEATCARDRVPPVPTGAER